MVKQFWKFSSEEIENFTAICSPGRKLLIHLKLKSEMIIFMGELKLSKIYQKYETNSTKEYNIL